MKLKELHFADVAEIQKAVTDELNKFQKEEFSAAFQKQAKACIHVYANGVHLNKKGHVSSIFKESALKRLDCTVYV
jgi:hypothetical protein